MLIMEWGPALQVGVEEMDQDHRVLFELLVRIQEATEQNDREETMAVLHELGSYTEWHFTREEALMRIHNYEFAAEHREEHQRLAQQVSQMMADMDQGVILPHDVAVFMQHWLINHIAGADRHAGEAIVQSREGARQPAASAATGRGAGAAKGR